MSKQVWSCAPWRPGTRSLLAAEEFALYQSCGQRRAVDLEGAYRPGIQPRPAGDAGWLEQVLFLISYSRAPWACRRRTTTSICGWTRRNVCSARRRRVWSKSRSMSATPIPAISHNSSAERQDFPQAITANSGNTAEFRAIPQQVWQYPARQPRPYDVSSLQH